MKTLLKILGITFILVVLLLFVLPFAFHKKIDTIIKKEGNEMLNAEFGYSRSDLSFYRNFPQASISIYDLWIKGEGPFASDTLVTLKELTLAVNLSSIFDDKGFDISKIEISDVNLKAIVLPDGQANWDILKESDKEESDNSVKAAETESNFKLKLRRLLIKELNVIYEDRQLNEQLSIGSFHLLCSGDFTNKSSLLNLQTKMDSLSYYSSGLKLLSNASVTSEFFIDADFTTQKYILKKNKISLNAISTSIDGWVAFPNEGIDMDLALNTEQVGLKELLSLFPAIYSNSFDILQADGKVTLNAWAKGSFVGDSIVPAFDLSLDIKEGRFQYPSLSEGIENIDADISISNPGGSTQNTTITVNPFKFTLANNPFSLTGTITNPTGDAFFNMEAKGLINLNSLSEIIPFGEVKLNGIIDTDVNLSGYTSAIENEMYDRISASGSIAVSNMKLRLMEDKEFDIKKSLLTFTPQYLQLSETEVIVGESDFSIESRLENYMGYLFKRGLLKGTLNLKSKYLNLDDFTTPTAKTNTEESPLSEIEDKASAEESNTEGGILLIPANVDFTLTTNIEQAIFNQMSLANINGRLMLKESTANMQNLSLNAMGGTVVVNGIYSSANINAPSLRGSVKMSKIVFAQAYKELKLIQKMAPIFENINGNFSSNMTVETIFDQDMSPILPSFQGKGDISTRDVSLSGISTIDLIADVINKPQLKELKADNIKIDFTIKDGRVYTDPFDVRVGDVALNLSGTTGLDQTIDYTGVVNTPIQVAGATLAKNVKFTIGGSFSSPKFALDTKSMATQAIESVSEKTKKQIGEALGLDSTSSSNIDSIKGKATEKALDFINKLLK